MCIIVSCWGFSVSLLSRFVCAQGFRAEWCQSANVSVVPAASASLKIDLSRRTEWDNTPLRHLCLSPENTKWDSPPLKTPPPRSHFPHRQSQARQEALRWGLSLSFMVVRGKQHRFLCYFVYDTIKYGNKKRGWMFFPLPAQKLLLPASLSVCVFLDRLARRESSRGEEKPAEHF